MILISNSNQIVCVERSKENQMDFHFKIVDRSQAERILNDSFVDAEVDVYVDCDEDAFILESNQISKRDPLSLIWQNGNVLISESTLSEFMSRAPELYPMLAIDKKGSPLMLAWGKPETILQATATGHGTYFSRSRNKKWVKGEESGHLQNLYSIYLSLDPFYILYETDQIGAACHTGYYSCFFRQIYKNEEPRFVYESKIEEHHE
jgi:phosphoribosyl-AMP cyclohydrolase